MITWRLPALVMAAALTAGWWPAPWLTALGIVGVSSVLAGIDVALAAPLREIRLSRDGDRVVWADATASVRLTVSNDSPRVLRGWLRDAWTPSAGASPDTHRIAVEPGAHQVVETVLRPTRRGDRPAVRVTLRSYGPLRLAYRQHRAGRAAEKTPQWTLRVLPRFASRRFLPEKVNRLRVLDGAVTTRGRGQGTEFDTLREYVVGDDIRSIDWRASARRCDVVVRTWRPERDRRVLCVLDIGRTSAVRLGDTPRLDASIDASLLLGALASRANDRVDLLAIDTAVRATVTNVGNRTLLWRLISAMASLEPTLVETDFELVAGEILRRERKRALVVLFTALEPAALGEGLLPVLPRLTARHKVVVAAVHDQSLTTLTTLGTGPGAAPGDRNPQPADVYLAAAAHRALAERDRVRAALTRRGVEVIDAPVDLFASQVADTYLTLKATGRL